MRGWCHELCGTWKCHLCGNVICVYALACCLHNWMPWHGNRCYSRKYMRTTDMCSTYLYYKSSKGSPTFLDISRKKRQIGFS